MRGVFAPIMNNPYAREYIKKNKSTLADKATYHVARGVGKLLGGRKGRRTGTKVAKFLSKARRTVFGFKKGGMVRR